MTLTQNVHRYSGFVLLGVSGILVATNILSDNLLHKVIGVLFVLSAAANYFTAPKTTAST